MSGLYDDLFQLPRHVSKTRPQMAVHNRAAQFSPFAALTGYNAAIRETARLTSERVDLGESEIADLEMKLNWIAERLPERPKIAVTHFLPDESKNGGAYITTTGAVKKLDEYERILLFADGTRIGLADVYAIECEMFTMPKDETNR